jgi:hypothetical protein
MKIVDPDPAPKPKDPRETYVVVIGLDQPWLDYYCNKIQSERDLLFTPEGYIYTEPLPSLNDIDEIHIVTQYPGPLGIRSMRTFTRWLNIAEQASIPITEVPI